MRSFLFSLSCFVTSLFVVGAAASSGHWEQIGERDGITTWILKIPGQDLPGFRGLTTINAGIEEIVEVMIDTPKQVEWMWHCKESRRIRDISETRAVVYNRTHAPWPAWDRDIVADVAWRYTPNKQALTFRFRSAQDPDVPPIDGVVRMPRLDGFYRLWVDRPGKTNVLYQIEADIAGDVPDFLARRYAKKLAFKTLQRLRERVDSRLKQGS